MPYFDQNFGEWDMSEEGMVDFFCEVQATNVEKECEGCGNIVKIQSHYAYCNDCADAIEQGRGQ